MIHDTQEMPVAGYRPFYKKLKFIISLDQEFVILYSLFSLYVHVEVYQNIFITKMQITCFYPR